MPEFEIAHVLIAAGIVLLPAFVGLVMHFLRRRDSSILMAKLEFANQIGAQQKEKIRELELDLNSLHERLAQQQTELALARQSVENEKKAVAEMESKFLENKQLLKQEFQSLANSIFEQNQEKFYTQSQQNLESVLKPFREQITSFKDKVEQIHATESKDRVALKTEIKMLQEMNSEISKEAANLTTALSGNKKVQGNWGEMILEQVLERSGLSRGVEYEREVTFNDEGVRRRADVIVHLPDNKHVIIDAKVSLNDYTKYVNAEDDVSRERALKSHVNALRLHIKGLSTKAYHHIDELNSPEFVFMFLPIESAFVAAVQNDVNVINDAFESQVVIVTPTTLLAALKTVGNLWGLERQNRYAKELADRGGRLYDKLRGFVEAMEVLGQQINTAHKTYDNTMVKLQRGHGNIISQSQKFVELGVRVKKQMSQSTLERSDLNLDGYSETQNELTGND